MAYNKNENMESIYESELISKTGDYYTKWNKSERERQIS